MFGTLEVKARPIRLGFVVEPHRNDHIREAIRLASTLWGGTFCPIIPAYKRMPRTWRDGPLKAPKAAAVIRGYIEAFDIDLIVDFCAEPHPEILKSGIERIQKDEIWRPLTEREDPVPACGIGIFEILNAVYKEHFRYKARFPIECAFPRIPREFGTFWAAVFGELPRAHTTLLKRRYEEALSLKYPLINSTTYIELLDYKKLFARRVMSHNLETTPRTYRDARSSVFFLDATSVEDVVDYWNLRALGGDVLAMPRQFSAVETVRQHVSSFLRARRVPHRYDPKHCTFCHFIKSRSTSEEEMADFARSLQLAPGPSEPSKSPYFVLQNWYPSIWDEWQRAHGQAIPDDVFMEGESVLDIAETDNVKVRVPTRTPSFAEEFSSGRYARCANEVSFRFYGEKEPLAEILPNITGNALRRLVSGLSIRGEWRVGRNGLVRFVNGRRSELRSIPLAQEVFFAWLKDHGWTARLSPAGILAKQIYIQTNGFPGMLGNEKLLAVLEHMNGGNVSRGGTQGAQPDFGHERDLEVGQVVSQLKDESGDNRLHDWLASIGAFKLGLRIQCPHCTRRSWFSMDSISDSFKCPKCLSSYAALGNLGDSRWCYKTAGPFSVPHYAEGAYVVLMALNVLAGNARSGSVRSTPVMSFIAESPDRKPVEADFAMHWQQSAYGETNHGLLFGECKTYGRFVRKDMDRMKQIASAFPGCVSVFATLNRSLAPDEKRLISAVARAGRRNWKPDHTINPVLVLTGSELLHYVGPPDCWDEAIQKRFPRIRGLLDICDITQQMYLDLPPFHDVQEMRWKKRLARQQRQSNQGNENNVRSASGKDN